MTTQETRSLELPSLPLRVRPGSPAPLGATWDGAGTNFALYSADAQAVELCLFDAHGRETRVALRERTDLVWHAHLEGVGPGQLYGYRVTGPWEPGNGLRFNENQVLLDPHAKALSGSVDWTRGAFAFDRHHPERDLIKNPRDEGPALLGVVIDPAFDWEGDAPPNTPLSSSIIYETHVKGLTARHPEVPSELRGSYLALATDPVIRHLTELGVTAVELLPVQHAVDELHLLEKGLSNYWGYDTIAFFAPDVRFRSGRELGAEVRQFKQMVKALHAAGIEVILDVVYNHTAEGNHLGPSLSLKGIDNRTYYRLVADDPRFYFDYTGTGNSLNVRNPQTLRLIMESLRYWVQEMHVDGFRFDLASTLARSLHEVDKLSAFFTTINQDPALAQVKLIAEPWDVGEGGYQVGNFPVRWAEWNGKYRDAMRAFWRGDGGRAGEIAYRLTGSADLYQAGGRSPAASVNLITAHDGFTLRDLVSYEEKHNEANLEENLDGSADNLSWNSGHEGETDDPEVLRLRQRRMRSFLATLFLSQGTPMLLGGDELGRTQRGNNNAYCQDNELSWYDWELDPQAEKLLAFTRRVIKLRRDHPLFRRSRFFEGRDIRGVGVADIVWFRHDGQPMDDESWNDPLTKSLGVFFAGSALDATDEVGRALVDDDLVLLLNSSEADLEFAIPLFGERGKSQRWEVLLDTWDDEASEIVEPGAPTLLRARSLKLLSRRALGPSGLGAAYGAPTSTYRLQLGPGMGFREAEGLLEYLDGLGVGGVYSSPHLRAAAGSSHGYDVVSHAELSPELGSEDDYRSLTGAMRARGFEHIVDFVPNHVGIGSGENAWWLDVLENGPSSLYADFFDVDWDRPEPGLSNKVLLPVLGAQFGEELEKNRLTLARDGREFWIRYFERRFPASLRSYRAILERAFERLALPMDDPASQELASIVTALRHLPPPWATAAGERAERAREKEVIKRRLVALEGASAEVGAAIVETVSAINQSLTELEAILLDQNYRLAYWRVAAEEVNYRRFFDINDLAAIRMEDPRVFAATHGLLFRLMSEGRVTGLRLDHTDGLYDPEAYFQDVQSGAHLALAAGGRDVQVPVYVVAEKILQRDEELRRSWAVSGTSGYDFLSTVNGLWVDPGAEQALTQLYQRFIGGTRDWASVVGAAKLEIMQSSLLSEIHMLGHALRRIAEKNRHARDFTLATLLRVIESTIAELSVYRTYVRPDGSRDASDEAHLLRAIERAKRQQRSVLSETAFDFLANVLLLQDRSPEAVWFAMRFQQLSGPVMAKGVEDTACYRMNRLVCLNEVGCSAGEFGLGVEVFHEENAARLARWPLAMTTTTTHDTKRSEDVRARIAVISELPKRWERLVDRLHELARPRLGLVDGERAPSADDEYLFYQTLLGALPAEGPDAQGSFVRRLSEYMSKAAREAKLRTSWINANADYESALSSFVTEMLADPATISLLRPMLELVVLYGACNSLSALALRLAAPGVPDVYQGSELVDLSLVDPDNRRPVDFALRKRLLAELDRHGPASRELCRELCTSLADGRAKLHLLRTGLRLRRREHELFLEGSYQPIVAGDHLVAFERRLGRRRLVALCPRFSAKLTRASGQLPLGAAWGEARVEIDPGPLVNVFDGDRHAGGELRLAEVFRSFPVAWLLA